MSIQKRLRSRLVGWLLSDKAESIRRSLNEQRRRLLRRPHRVSVFLELDDPYSYLLAQYLPSLAESYDVELRLYLTEARDDQAYRPHGDMLAVYAEDDCARLARELGLPFLDNGRAPPVEHRRALIESLAASAQDPHFGDELLQCISMYWRGDAEGIARRVTGVTPQGAGDRLLARNQERLVDLGHYLCATLHYAGEWYWGVDRLHYLVKRLDATGARRKNGGASSLASIPQAMHVSLPVAPPNAARELPSLELFFSFRSPYSYLCLRRTFAIADAFGLQLVIRPVLPMVMRSLEVPKSKLMYILADARREAQRLGIPFGRIADPLGTGIERCMAVFYYAQGEKRERDFVLNAAEAIMARGIDVATDKGMRKVTGRTGLFWPDVVAAMEEDAWRASVEENRESMLESGSWGVPTIRLGDFVVWGQDRDWLLVRHIEELCDTGDGILV